MANLYITEYEHVGSIAGLRSAMPIAKEPALVDQTVSFTTATASSAFNTRTKFVRILADADCYVVFGADPTATASNQKLTANVEYWRGVDAGDKISVYDGSS